MSDNPEENASIEYNTTIGVSELASSTHVSLREERELNEARNIINKLKNSVKAPTDSEKMRLKRLEERQQIRNRQMVDRIERLVRVYKTLCAEFDSSTLELKSGLYVASAQLVLAEELDLALTDVARVVDSL